MLYLVFAKLAEIRPSKLVWVLLGLSFVVAVAPFGFAKIGGVSSSKEHPVTWHSDSVFLVVFDEAEAGSVGCVVTPENGARETIMVPGMDGPSGLLEYRGMSPNATFSGEATVVCPQGRVFLGPTAILAHLWIMWFILVFAAWLVVAYVRHRIGLRDT